TTTVLTVANTVLTQRWPVREPDRVLTVVNRNGVMDMSPAEARFIGARATTVAAVVSERCLEGLIEQCRLKLDDDSATVDFVSGNFFSALGVGIQIGRPLLPSDDQLDAPSAVA